MPVTGFYSPGPLPAPRHGTLCLRASKRVVGKGGAPWEPPVPRLHQWLRVELQMLAVQLTAPSCHPAWEQSAFPSRLPEAGHCACVSRG